MQIRFKSSVSFCRISAILILVLLGSLRVDAQCNVQQIHKLLADDGSADDIFGRSVSISGTTAIVGARRDDDNGENSGSAYLFDTTTGQQIAKLLADDAGAFDYFGGSVAISGTTAIVGASFDDDNGENSGSAYLFDTTTGQQIAKLVPDDNAADDHFGISVSISGTTAIVGALWDDDNGRHSGSAYLFDTSTAMQTVKLLPNDGAAEDRFGNAVAFSGNVAIVGAKWDNDNGENSGSAYLFDITTGQQIAKLLPEDGEAGDEFGYRVSIDGTTAIVGAWFDHNNDGAGSAYLFDTITGQQIYKLLAGDGEAGDRFGFGVAISGNVAIVGAPDDNDNGESSGSAYLFDTKTGQQIAKLLPDDGAADDYFGVSVSISGTTAIVGATGDDDNGSVSGSAYLFDVSCTDDVAPDSLTVTRGLYVSGDETDLADSDNMDFSLRRSNTDLQSRTEFEVKGISPTAAPTSFEFTLEGSVFARGNVVQTIEFFDYDLGVWELVDTSDANRAPMPDKVVTATPTGDLTRFVEAGTMCIEARIHFQSDRPRQRFASNTDQAVWTIGQ